jgi:hypothetical protein
MYLYLQNSEKIYFINQSKFREGSVMNRAFLISAGFIVVLGSAPPAFALPHSGVVFDALGNQDSETSIQRVSGRNSGGHRNNGYRGGHSRSHEYGNSGGHRNNGYRGGHSRSHGYRNHGGHRYTHYRGGHSYSHGYRNHGGYRYNHYRGGHSYNYGYRSHGGLHLYNFYNPYYIPFGNSYSGGYPYQGWGYYNRNYGGLAYGPYLCLEH